MVVGFGLRGRDIADQFLRTVVFEPEHNHLSVAYSAPEMSEKRCHLPLTKNGPKINPKKWMHG